MKTHLLTLLALLNSIAAFAAKPDPFPVGWSELRVGRHYSAVSHLLRKSTTEVPLITQVSWHYYYYTQGLAIDNSALKRQQYTLNPDGDYKFYLGVPVQMIYVDFDQNDRIAAISLFFPNDFSCKLNEAFCKENKVKEIPCRNQRSEASYVFNKDSLHYEFFSNQLIDSVYIGYTIIRFSGGPQTIADEVRHVKKLSAGTMHYTFDFNGFGEFTIGKSLDELKPFLENEPGFDYYTLAGNYSTDDFNRELPRNCWHPRYNYTGWKKYDSIDVLVLDLFFDGNNRLKRINIVMRDTPENRNYLMQKMTDQFSSPHLVQRTTVSADYWQGSWNIKRRQINLSATYRRPGARQGPPAVITLSITEH
ncbi:MAG: hypothetical protein IM638_20015 [Bacteroidetes bacterium]|nr:hypothetical protein [Bacteroidota bacterium]